MRKGQMQGVLPEERLLAYFKSAGAAQVNRWAVNAPGAAAERMRHNVSIRTAVFFTVNPP